MALTGAQSYSDVMMTEAPSSSSPYESATLEFLFERVWARPGLGRRQRRLVTLACVCAADATGPMDAHMYAALASGDLDLEELQEFILHFAVYCGWPKASAAQASLLTQVQRLGQERGEETAPLPALPLASLGPADHEERLRKGEECFVDVNLAPAPPRDTPYFQAGILNFVFGHVWQRPNLSRVDRRFVTIPCVGLSDAAMPIQAHVGSALRSGDISITEMNEIVLQFSAYYGFAKGEVLNRAATEAWAQITAEAH
jgi:4-carboxymuconolactone decarboxylase